MFGYVSYKLVREDGTVEEFRQNTIVNAALDRMGKFISEGNKGTAGISYLKIGTAKAIFVDPAKNIDLLRPEFSVNLYQKSYLVEGGDGKLIDSDHPTNYTSFRFKVDLYNPKTNIEISEFGLFSKDDTLFSYVFLDTPIAKRINDVLFVDWVIIIYPPLGKKVNTFTIDYDEFWKMEKPLPVPLSIDYASPNGPVFKWVASEQVGVAGYNVYRKQYPNSWYDKIDTVETEVGTIKAVYRKPINYTDTSLEWGKFYTYNIKVFNVSDKESDYVDDVVFPAIYVNAFPKDTKVELVWTHILGWDLFDHYNVYKLISKNQREFITSIRSNTYTVTGLTNGTGYTFIVTLVDSNNIEYTSSFEAYAVPLLDYPDTPNIMSADPSDQCVTLTWFEEDDTAKEYDVYTVSYTSGVPYYSFLSHLDASIISGMGSHVFKADVCGLLNDELYKFVLKAIDEEGERSDFSNSVNATPTYIMLAMPKSFRGLGMDKAVQLNWSVVKGAVYYNIYKMGSGDWEWLDSTHDNFYIAGGLINGIFYNFRVVAVDNKDREGISTSAVAISPYSKVPPSIPSNLSYTVESAGGGVFVIYLAWNSSPETDVVHYNVYGSGGNIGLFQQIGEVTLPAFQHIAASGENYSFVVTAVDTSGNESGFSNEALVFIP